MSKRILVLTIACALLSHVGAAQELSGTLIGTVQDAQGGALRGAMVRVSSPALIGGAQTSTTNEQGQLRFPALPPGLYMLDVERQGIRPYHEEDIRIGVGATIERTVGPAAGGHRRVGRRAGRGLTPRSARERIRDPLRSRGSQGDPGPAIQHVRLHQGRSGCVADLARQASRPTACRRSARAQRERIPHRRHELHLPVQRRGAIRAGRRLHSGSARPVGGRVGRVRQHAGRRDQRRHRQGGDRFLYDASYYGQTAGLTSRPVQLAYPGSGQPDERVRARHIPRLDDESRRSGRCAIGCGSSPDTSTCATTTASRAPIRRSRGPTNRTRSSRKLTWRIAPAWQLLQSFHDEFWVNPELPTRVKPFEATQRRHASVPAMTFGHLTHTSSSNTVWDVRVGRFVFDRKDDPSTGDPSIAESCRSPDRRAQWRASELRRPEADTHDSQGARSVISARPRSARGSPVEGRLAGRKGRTSTASIIPTGVRYTDDNGRPFQAISAAPSLTGGLFITASGFVSDAITIGDRLTVNAGLRFDHSRAISQDLPTLDLQGHETDTAVEGLGRLYTWNVWSPRLGRHSETLATTGAPCFAQATAGSTRASSPASCRPFHPGATSTTTMAWNAADRRLHDTRVRCGSETESAARL